MTPQDFYITTKPLCSWLLKSFADAEKRFVKDFAATVHRGLILYKHLYPEGVD